MADIEALYSKTKRFIVNLSKKSCLSSFYIGKSKDVDTREFQHLDDGFERTIEIAHSLSADIINNSEKYLITMFNKENLSVTFDNKRGGGGGNPDASKLYISLHFNPQKDNDLDDDDLDFESMELK